MAVQEVQMTELKETLTVPAAMYRHPSRGIIYRRPEYSIKFTKSLVMTGKNYYDSREALPEGIRMSTAAEELAPQLALEKAGKDPGKAKIFDDLFGRNDQKWYAWQWTDTGLRVPSRRRADKYEEHEDRKYWPRIVLIGDEEVGEVLVPEGDGRLVTEWDEVFGIPSKTEEISYPHKPYTTHFYFDSDPSKDDISGKYDVAVARGGGWLHGNGERCLGVSADCERWAAFSSDGFRPVQGSFPEIETE